jgi:hypothetical protein
MMVHTARRRRVNSPIPTPSPVPSPALKAVDGSGRVWTHHNPLELHRRLAARNALLASVEAALKAAPPRGDGRPIG